MADNDRYVCGLLTAQNGLGTIQLWIRQGTNDLRSVRISLNMIMSA